MKQFTFDLRKLTVADATKGMPVLPGPRRPVSSTEQALIKSALALGKPFDPSLGGLHEVEEISEPPPR
jgi:hypothetical protein